METRGIDRVMIGVRDLDAARSFFSELLGVEFVELTGPTVRALEQRAAISLKGAIELISPVTPLSDAAPEYMQELAAALKERDLVMMGFSYLVDRVDRVEEEFKARNLDFMVFETAEFDGQMSWSGYQELFLDKKHSHGLALAFSQYHLAEKTPGD